MSGAYRDTADAYWGAGWRGVLPLPPGRKGPPPPGFTGWAGVEPSYADVHAWAEGGQGDGNVALRLPIGVYGLDVDDYEGKSGGMHFNALVTALGPLPPTWIVSSRELSASGIRLYAAELPPGWRWKNEPAGHGAGIESIHFGHRYAVVAPSMHPDTGRKYVWRRPDGQLAEYGELPPPGSLPRLPAAWVAALAEPGEHRTGDVAGEDETREVVAGWNLGEACRATREAQARAVARLRDAHDGAALHPAAVASTQELVSLGHEGHRAARAALARHYSLFCEVRVERGGTQDAAAAEWWRMVRGAVGKLVEADGVEECDCDQWSGAGVTFTLAELGVPELLTARAEGDELAQAHAESSLEQSYPPVTEDPVEAMRAELLSSTQIAQQPAPVPLVRGLLFLNTLAWLIGKSGSFKSFVALDIAQHVGSGVAWAGRRVRQGPVLYLVAEGAGGMTLRMRAWAERNGTPSDDVWFLPRPVQAKSDEWTVLVRLVARLMPVLIVIDTQARVTLGIQENDNSDMGLFIAQVDRLRLVTRACVLLVHHIGRQGEDARGASAIDGAQDTELKIERTAGAKGMAARLVTDKQKDSPDTEAVEFEMAKVDLGTDPETGDELNSLVVSTALFSSVSTRPWDEDLAENLSRIMGVLHDQFYGIGATSGELLAVLRERGWTKTYTKSTYYRCLRRLVEMNLIGKVKGTQRWAVVITETPDDHVKT